MTRKGILLEDIRVQLEALGSRFINDNVEVQTLERIRVAASDVLQDLVTKRRIRDFRAEAVRWPDGRTMLRAAIQPENTAELAVVDLIINP